jgi:arsenate reductase (thioredoxin)
MAEELANHLKGHVVEAWSAGVDPEPVHPLAVRVLAEIGVKIPDRKARHVRELAGIDFGYVVTLCGTAAETLPVFPPETKVSHVGFRDPAAASGSEKERLKAFRRVRDGIVEFVENLPWELEHNQEDE